MATMRRRILWGAACLATAWWCGFGCAERLPDGAALAAYAEAARDDASAAQAAGDLKAARAAAERADRALAKAEKDVERAPEAAKPAATELAAQVRRAAREAAGFVGLAEEEQKAAKKCAGWKARGYLAARRPALKVVFLGMGLATEHAAAKGYDSLSPEQKKAVARATLLTGDLRLPDGEPDWKAIAAKVKGFADAPPAEFSVMLALGFAALEQYDLALTEAHAIDLSGVADPREAMACRATRGVVYQLNGLPRMSQCEFEAILAESADGGQVGPELVSGVRLFLAVLRLKLGDVEGAARELAQAGAAWPDSAVGGILKSELLAADGKYDEAAAALEEALVAAGEKADPWMAARMTTRARGLRQERAAAPPLLGDDAFLRQVVERSVWEAAKTSQAAGRIKDHVDSVRDFGRECLKHLPGTDAEEETP